MFDKYAHWLAVFFHQGENCQRESNHQNEDIDSVAFTTSKTHFHIFFFPLIYFFFNIKFLTLNDIFSAVGWPGLLSNRIIKTGLK